jgi:hypothetical protein
VDEVAEEALDFLICSGHEALARRSLVVRWSACKQELSVTVSLRRCSVVKSFVEAFVDHGRTY